MNFNDPVFWSNFFPNLLANLISDLVVGVLLVLIFTWFWSRFTRPRAKVIGHLYQLEQDRVGVSFKIENNGRDSFRAQEIYWHVYIDSAIPLLKDYPKENLPAQSVIGVLNPSPAENPLVDDKPFRKYVGILQQPIFPFSHVPIFTVVVDTKSIRLGNAYYYLSTAHGAFPRHYKVDRRGSVRAKDLGWIMTVSDKPSPPSIRDWIVAILQPR